jgi:hypothetical protein
MLSVPHYLDNRLTDSGNVVSPTHRPHFSSQKHYFSASDTNFFYRLGEPQGPVRPEGLGELEKIHLIGSRTRDLQACSLLPLPS